MNGRLARTSTEFAMWNKRKMLASVRIHLSCAITTTAVMVVGTTMLPTKAQVKVLTLRNEESKRALLIVSCDLKET